VLVAFHALAFVVEPPLLAWSERLRVRWFSAASLAVVALSSFVAAAVANRWIFLGALTVFGPAIGCALAVSEGLLVEARPHERERTMARIALAGTAGDLAVPALLAGASLVGLDWRAVLVVAGVAASILAVTHAASPTLDRRFGFHDDDDDEDAAIGWRERLRAALAHRALLAWSFAGATATLLDEIFVAFGVVHLHAHGATTNERALAVGAWVVGGSIGLAALERFVARLDARKLLVIACATTIAALSVIAAAPSIAVALVAFFFVGAAGSTVHPLTRARCYAALPGRPALVHAVAGVFAPFDLLVPIPLGLLAARFGSAAAVVSLVAAPVIAALVAVCSPRQPPRRAR